MSIAKPFNPRPTTHLYDVEKGVFKTSIPGFASEVETYGAPLSFRKVEVLRDDSVTTEKRDRFNRRDAFCQTVAEAGAFEFAIAKAPSVDGKRIVKCQWCGTLHNWAVFYRRATDGTFLGWSGVNCFDEVVHNLHLPAADALAEYAKKEHHRCEQFIETMKKITDFKRDFPGLYEHREVLRSGRNPYARLWQEVEARLNSAKGVDEEWLAACEAGEFDRSWTTGGRRSWRRRLFNDDAARRIPKYLQVTSSIMKGGSSIDNLIQILNEKHAAEIEAKRLADEAAIKAAHAAQVAARAAQQPMPAPAPVQVVQPKPAPAPVVNDTKPRMPNDEEVLKAKELLGTGAYDWSFVVKNAAKGGLVLSANSLKRVHEWHAKAVAQGAIKVAP